MHVAHCIKMIPQILMCFSISTPSSYTRFSFVLHSLFICLIDDLILICRFSVKTDLHTGKAVSRLYIANANRHDSGNYTCALGDFAKVTVSVHVLNGKYEKMKLDLLLLSFMLSPHTHEGGAPIFMSNVHRHSQLHAKIAAPQTKGHSVIYSLWFQRRHRQGVT